MQVKSRNSKFNFDEEYVVITAEPDTIIPELEKYKLEQKKLCCTPQIREWGKLQKSKNSKDLIFSSSDYFDLEARSSKLGGGIFVANVANQEYEKKIDGQYRQIIKLENYHYVIEYVKKFIYLIINFKLYRNTI